MKKIISLVMALLLIFSFSSAVFASEKYITDSFTPVYEGRLKYSVKFGGGYRSAPTPPVIADNYIITVATGKIHKTDRANGKLIATKALSCTNFYTVVSPLVKNGMIFVQLDSGVIEALDLETLETLWIYKDPLEGQALCPIVYDNGFIYTGFWNGETENANYVCLAAEDTDKSTGSEQKNAEWYYTSKGGFYCVTPAVSGEHLILGKDNGEADSTSASEIIALDKKSGKKVSSLSVSGDIRSGVSYSEKTDCFYTASKAGYIYKFSCDKKTGVLHSLQSFKTAGEMTCTPVIYGLRLYAAYGKGTAGEFAVLDAKNLSVIYTCDIKGYAQGNLLLSTAYKNENGKIYIYMTYNSPPGGITVFEDSEKQTVAVKRELFMPYGNASQYCISPISADEDGVLYYKNDSGYIFAVEEYEQTAIFIEKLENFLNRIITLIKRIQTLLQENI